MRYKLIGYSALVFSTMSFIYFLFFGVETSDELEFLLIGIAITMTFLFGLAFIYSKEKKK